MLHCLEKKMPSYKQLVLKMYLLLTMTNHLALQFLVLSLSHLPKLLLLCVIYTALELWKIIYSPSFRNITHNISVTFSMYFCSINTGIGINESPVLNGQLRVLESNSAKINLV